MEKDLIIKRLSGLIEWASNIRDDVITVNGKENNGAKEWQLDIDALTSATTIISKQNS